MTLTEKTLFALVGIALIALSFQMGQIRRFDDRITNIEMAGKPAK